MFRMESVGYQSSPDNRGWDPQPKVEALNVIVVELGFPVIPEVPYESFQRGIDGVVRVFETKSFILPHPVDLLLPHGTTFDSVLFPFFFTDRVVRDVRKASHIYTTRDEKKLSWPDWI